MIATVLGFAAVAPAAHASDRRPRRIVVADETLYISRVLARVVAIHARLWDWAHRFKREDAEWREATRYRRLRGGASFEDKLHVGRKPLTDPGSRWLIPKAYNSIFQHSAARKLYDVASQYGRAR